MAQDARKDSTAGRLADPISNAKNSIVITTEVSYKVERDVPSSEAATHEADHDPLTGVSSLGNLSTPVAPNPSRSSTPTLTPKAPGHLRALATLNRNSPFSKRGQLLIGRYRATGHAAPLASGERATLPCPRVPVFRPLEHAAHVKRRKENADALAYFNIAILLFITLIVVWVPSTITCVYQIVHPDSHNYGLNLLSALVLPMQGFGNAVIYAQATPAGCKHLWALVVAEFTGQKPKAQPVTEEIIRYNASVTDTQDTEMSPKGPRDEESHPLPV